MLLIGIVIGALVSAFYTGIQSGDPDRFGSGLKQLLEVPRVDIETPKLALPPDRAPEAVVAVLEAGTLQRELGEDDLATETLRGGLSAAEGKDPLQGLLLIRLASASERDGDWVAAASLYEQAGRLPGYPAAAQALADAARSYAAANDAARAIALYDESVERAGKPSAPHIRSVIEELRAIQGP